jgi:two-component system sensor histidine kinase KdpD
LVATPDGPQVRAANPAEDRLDTIELAAVTWVLERGVPAGRGSDTLTASDWLFYPLRNASETLAAIGMSRDDGGEPIKSDQLPLLMNLLDQASLAIERARLTEEMQGMAQLKERDRLRAALLSSVSHDLRTPLTAILASTAELRREATPELIDGIEAEAQRLNRFVANLLDMARVEAGALKLNIEAIDLADAIASAVHDTRRALDGHAIEMRVAADLPLVRVDPQLFHHILINLLDNAGRYAEPGTPIVIQAEREPGSLTLAVLDEGPGLPPGRERDVFETFKRIEGSDRKQAGTGLGLAIVKGFAEALGLEVEAANRGQPVGARFTIRFPEAVLFKGMDTE